MHAQRGCHRCISPHESQRSEPPFGRCPAPARKHGLLGPKFAIHQNSTRKLKPNFRLTLLTHAIGQKIRTPLQSGRWACLSLYPNCQLI
jgi:hypothetical protein